MTGENNEVSLKKEQIAIKEIKNLQKQLATLQQQVKKAKIPVIILIDGWSASGKGPLINEISSQLEARGYRVCSSTQPEVGEARRPYLWRFWRDIPEYGDITIIERGWYRQALESELFQCDDSKDMIESIRNFERQLADDGYLVLKFFINIDKKTQKSRLEKLSSKKSTAWRVQDRDWLQNAKHKYILRARKKLMAQTNDVWCRWNVIDNENPKIGAQETLKIICRRISETIESLDEKPKFEPTQNIKTIPMKKLSDIDLNVDCSDIDFEREMKKERKKIQKLHSVLYREKIPFVICFEGWDAAGKGGAIRRLTWALDPRGFQVNSVAAPSAQELNHHYLWRFWNIMTKDGHIGIFDRSWYGRVMVEKIEHITGEDRCNMAYQEINEFEYELNKWGAIVLKFWIHIDKDTQLERFTLRQATPEKQHKITEEDWRNRGKWEEYETAVDEMIAKTSTSYAPWVIVEGNNKKYARLKVLQTVRKAMEQRLKHSK